MIFEEFACFSGFDRNGSSLKSRLDRFSWTWIQNLTLEWPLKSGLLRVRFISEPFFTYKRTDKSGTSSSNKSSMQEFQYFSYRYASKNSKNTAPAMIFKEWFCNHPKTCQFRTKNTIWALNYLLLFFQKCFFFDPIFYKNRKLWDSESGQFLGKK